MHATQNRFLAGFGLGALNDADEDDIDVYDGGRNTSKSKIAYDISEREGDTVVLTQKKAKVEPVRMDFTLCAIQTIYTSKRRTTTYATFSNGLPVLPGFVLADKVQEDEWFGGVEVPPDWKPNPKRVWDADPNKENIQAQATKSEPVPYHKWKTSMTAEEVNIYHHPNFIPFPEWVVLERFNIGRNPHLYDSSIRV